MRAVSPQHSKPLPIGQKNFCAMSAFLLILILFYGLFVLFRIIDLLVPENGKTKRMRNYKIRVWPAIKGNFGWEVNAINELDEMEYNLGTGSAGNEGSAREKAKELIDAHKENDAAEARRIAAPWEPIE